MKTSIWGLLLLAGLSTTSPIQPTQAPLLSSKEVVEFALELYNEKSGETWTFELVEAATDLDWNVSSERPQHFSMKIKATGCPLKDKEPCDFPDGGVVEQCSGYYLLQEDPPVVLVGCEEVSEEEDEEEDVKDEEEEEEEEEDKVKDEDEVENKEPERKREKRFVKKWWKKGKKGLRKRLRKLKKKKFFVSASIPF